MWRERRRRRRGKRGGAGRPSTRSPSATARRTWTTSRQAQSVGTR